MEFRERLNTHLESIGKDYVWLCSQLRENGFPELLPQTVKRWVDGKSMPRTHHLAAIAKVFKVPMDSLC